MSEPACWHSFHLYYHGDLDLLLSRLVHPLIHALAEEPGIEGFFFVRFMLGGPHVRLRLCLKEGAGEAARARIAAMTAGFFAEHPAARTLSAEEVRRNDAVILANDPYERGTGFVPAPSVHERPFEPEVERYGGEALLPASLCAFVLSSARALRFLVEHADAPRAKRLPASLRQVVAEAAGFAASADDLRELLAAPFARDDSVTQALIARGDRVFTEQREAFYRLVRAELEARRATALPLALLDPAAAARALAGAIDAAPAAVRRCVAVSQIHMSANRLGLTNAEEVYLGRIAWSAVSLLLARDPALTAQLDLAPAGADALRSALDLREAAARAPREIGLPYSSHGGRD